MRRCVRLIIISVAVLSLACCSSPSTPLPRGYFRISFPEHEYVSLQDDKYADVTKDFPYSFELNNISNVVPHEGGEQYWIDLVYPQYDVCVHCSYKPVENNLRELSDDAQRFVFNHAGKASAIPEQGYENDEERVYGVMFELIGNAASPCQFYLTDSTRNFFRAAVYFSCIPNQDSLVPVRDYVVDDMRHLIETMQWQ